MHVISWISIVFVPSLLISSIETFDRELRITKNKRFLLYRKYAITQRPCKCSTPFSCSCCEVVTLLYSKRRRELCSNFTYQRNGLNVDISLGLDTLRTATITDYRPFKICTAIPGSLFSSVCVNVIELNEFSRSLTVCVRHEIMSKTQEWQIDYTCVSISTELPAAFSSTARMSSPGVTSPVSEGSPMPENTTQKPPEPSAPPEGPPEPPEMPPGDAASMEPAPPAGEPDAEMPAAAESPTAIVGARKRRGTKFKFRKSKIVNVNDDHRPEFNIEKPKTPTQPPNASVPIYSYKLPIEIPSPSPNTQISADEPVDDVLPVPNRTERYEFHNRTQYFPNRIPPIIAKSMNNAKITLKNETHYEIMPKNSIEQNETDIIVFPE